MLVIGNLCLSIGLLLRLFVHPSGLIHKNLLDGVCGLLIGLSIGINLFVVRLAHRCHQRLQ